MELPPSSPHRFCGSRGELATRVMVVSIRSKCRLVTAQDAVHLKLIRDLYSIHTLGRGFLEDVQGAALTALVSCAQAVPLIRVSISHSFETAPNRRMLYLQGVSKIRIALDYRLSAIGASVTV